MDYNGMGMVVRIWNKHEKMWFRNDGLERMMIRVVGDDAK